jgi:fido (protein-threonine AMPylation protein)
MPNCPGWEYQQYLGHGATLAPRAKGLYAALGSNTVDSVGSSKNTRPVHERLFNGLTPPNYSHYAGNYRGCSKPCLTRYVVEIREDPRVGYPPVAVQGSMDALATRIDDDLARLDAEVNVAGLPVNERLLKVVEVVAAIFEKFLEIHPYANGNGHAGRYIAVALLSKYGYWLPDWIEPRPPDKEYSDCIKLHRDNKRTHLHKYFLKCLGIDTTQGSSQSTPPPPTVPTA